MNENERDTQFLEAATLLLRAQEYIKLDPEGHVLVSDAQKLYANFLFDFAMHIWTESGPEQPFSDIPDLTEWPKNPLQEP